MCNHTGATFSYRMQKKLDNIYAPACTGMSSTRSKLIKATPIAVVAIAVYAFFQKVVYKDIVYYGDGNYSSRF